MIDVVVYAMMEHRKAHLLAAVDQGGRREIDLYTAREYDRAWDAALEKVVQGPEGLMGAVYFTYRELREQGAGNCLHLLNLIDRYTEQGPVDACSVLDYALTVEGVTRGAA